MTVDGINRTHPLMLSKPWGDRAEENVQKWGNQGPSTLFLAMVEELGEVAEELAENSPGPHPDHPDDAPFRGWELIHEMADLGEETREFLEENFEEPAGKPKSENERREVRKKQALGTGFVQDPDPIQQEVDDLAPLLYQLTWALEEER